MGQLKILYIPGAPTLEEELQSCFLKHRLEAAVTRVEDLDALSKHCAQASFDIVILDSTTPVLPVQIVIDMVREAHCSCQIYALFDKVDEEAITSVIHWGATSFALTGNLASLVAGIRKRETAPHQGTVNVKYLKNSQHILKAFLEESTDSIWVKDRAGKYVLINPAGAHFLGKPIDQIIGKGDDDVFPPETARKVKESDRHVMDAGKTQAVEDLLITLDGVNRTFHAVKGVFRDEHGEVQGVIGTVRDITARKQAEEALKSSEQRFRLLVEGVKDHAIYMLDPDGNVTTWNIGAERLHGYQADEVIGLHFSNFFSQEDSRMALPEHWLQTALEQGSYEQETWHIRKDSTMYWANMMITPLYGALPELIGYSVVVRDMSERRKTEEKLRYYAARLEQSNKDLEEFAFIASHDLQAPLRKIKIFTEILRELVGDEGRDTSRRLQVTVEKMQHFITDLLALSRINRKGRPFKEVDLGTVIASAMDSLELVIQENRAIITLKNLGVVHGDEAQLEQLFQNLLSNSLKYRKPTVPPEIKIKGELLMNDFYQVTIQDNGIGFKEKFIEKIFQPFERLHNDTIYPGTGMGLAICKKIVERHGGQISANSQEWDGATFILYLPAMPGKKFGNNEPADAERLNLI